MSLSEKARELAGKIDKATPGGWLPPCATEAPDMIRQLADENERLRWVVDQAVKFGGLRLTIRDFREIIQDGDGGWDYAMDYPDLADELCRREAQ